MKNLLKIALLGTALTVSAALAAGPATDWPVSGHDQGGARYSPLTQITKSNVTRLAQAWTYHLTPA
ncbi:MAG: Quinoprotein glucose dehydrogenase, partial [Alphaproteobacteria bacterium]|nr:Quinoprotein glucose dehydrogenase [Alphaproteobacteria bacterium]